MRLAEMESCLLSQHKSDAETAGDLEEALKLLETPEPGTNEARLAMQMTPEKKCQLLTDAVTKLRRSLKSLTLDRLALQRTVKELEGRIAGDADFHATAREEFKKSKELVLFYQVLVADILDRTKIFKEGNKATPEDRVMFQEILELEGERRRKDAAEARNSLRVDPRKALTRLSNYVDEVHDIMLALNVRQLFKKYQLVVQEKGAIAGELIGEMVRLGLVDPSVLPEHILAQHEAAEEARAKREEALAKKAAQGKRSPPRRPAQPKKAPPRPAEQPGPGKAGSTQPDLQNAVPAPLRAGQTAPWADEEQQRGVEGLVLALAMPVEEGALAKVQEERDLAAQGRAPAEELTGMEAEFAELLAAEESLALSSSPEQAAERQLFVEKLEAQQHTRADAAEKRAAAEAAAERKRLEREQKREADEAKAGSRGKKGKSGAGRGPAKSLGKGKANAPASRPSLSRAGSGAEDPLTSEDGGSGDAELLQLPSAKGRRAAPKSTIQLPVGARPSAQDVFPGASRTGFRAGSVATAPLHLL